jgi:LysR family transcriptional regulator, benzoate and cis,cis-muconate-responsive activator of ben and cat genes
LLRYFLAVAEELNFTRAANRLHIAQPSLSSQIRQLEGQLGVTLLRRSTREVGLTEAGRALVDRGPAALAGLERAWEGARQAGRGEVGTLRMVYPLSAGHDTAPQLVQALHDAYPRIEVTTEVVPTPKVMRAVREGRADVGIARAPAPVDGTRVFPLRHDAVGILVAAGHPLAANDTAELSEVAHYPVVLHPRSANPSHYDFIIDLFASRGLQARVVERDIAFDLSHHLIANGTASALVGQSSASGLPANVCWVPVAGRVTVPVALVIATGQPRVTVQRFHDVASAHAVAHGWLA